MLNQIRTILRMASVLGIILLCVFLSCSEWTPEVDGYFTIDGIKHPVHLATIDVDSFSGSASVTYRSGLTFSGAPAYYVAMEVLSTSKTIAPGAYPLEYFASAAKMKIEYCRIRFGDDSKDISSGTNSNGLLTLATSGNEYTFEFDGIINGHDLKIHYVGRVQIR